MTRADHAPNPEALRAAVREAIGTRSLREVAAEIGISHTGLRGFLGGATPHRHTRRKIERWLIETRSDRIRETDRAYGAPAARHTFELGRAAVRDLAAGLDPTQIDRAVRDYQALVRRLFRSARRTPPTWLDEEENEGEGEDRTEG